MLTHDIYFSDYGRYMTVMNRYHRPDNPLFIPETGISELYARYIFAALGHQAIGFSPFGVDYTEYDNWPLGARRLTPEKLMPYALNYRLLRPMASRIAALSFAGKVWGVSQPENVTVQTLNLGKWRARIAYDRVHFSHRLKPPDKRRIKAAY
jgi:hypothetical protein